MPHKAWLQSLADMLSTFSENQAPSKQLIADIQLVLDEAVVIAMNHGARLPNFVVEATRLEAIHHRLGRNRIAELAAQPVPNYTVDAMVPLIVRLCTDLDAMSTRSGEKNA
jgi:hypothetical protein